MTKPDRFQRMVRQASSYYVGTNARSVHETDVVTLLRREHQAVRRRVVTFGQVVAPRYRNKSVSFQEGYAAMCSDLLDWLDQRKGG